MPNFARSSACHCGASWGEHRTASRSASPVARSSAATSPASIVLPTPTPSAISSLRDVLGNAHHQRDELVVPGADSERRERSEWACTGAK